MKKLILIIISFILLVGCSEPMFQSPEKPFIICKKYPSIDTIWTYRYVDKNNNVYWFKDTYNKYEIGDTIK